MRERRACRPGVSARKLSAYPFMVLRRTGMTSSTGRAAQRALATLVVEVGTPKLCVGRTSSLSETRRTGSLSYSLNISAGPHSLDEPCLLSFRPARQKQLVDLVPCNFRRCLVRPRGNRRLIRRIKRLHRFPDRIDTVREQIADQEVGDE